MRREADGTITVKTSKREYRTFAAILALGRAGTPRKLGVRGEELPKVMYRLLEGDHYVNRKILIVGGGDSAVEAAMGLALQRGNEVTVSYRRPSFLRIKERNAERLGEAVRSGRVKILFNSMPVEINEDSVVLEVEGSQLTIANDYVWVFAGGVAPNDFLRGLGIQFGEKDLTPEIVGEAREELLARQ